MKFEITKKNKYSKESLFEDIKKTWIHYGETPTLKQTMEYCGYKYNVFTPVFKKWSIALKEFCEWANNGADVENKKVSETADEEAEIEDTYF